MIAAVDACYGPKATAAACVTFETWTASKAASETIQILGAAPPYVPGHFWLRELSPALSVILSLKIKPTLVVVDGYVWLNASRRKGLGAHLFEALQARIPVIGVAKAAFRTSGHAQCLFRGRSKRPLYITAQGVSLAEASAAIASMHGDYRIPTLLKRADELSRRALNGESAR